MAEDVGVRAQVKPWRAPEDRDISRHSPGHPARSVAFMSAGLLARGSSCFSWPSRVGSQWHWSEKHSPPTVAGAASV